jgi:hypothetical protein
MIVDNKIQLETLGIFSTQKAKLCQEKVTFVPLSTPHFLPEMWL